MINDTIDFDDIKREATGIRVHGNGFIQIDIDAHRRVHVFGHPKLARQSIPTPVHNHRFGFVSRVLRGRLINVRYDVALSPVGALAPYRAFTPMPRQDEDTVLVDYGMLVYLRRAAPECLLRSESYQIEPGEFHETLANEPAVTLMTKCNTYPEIVPMVLCAYGQQPDNDFMRYDFDDSELWRLVYDAWTWGGQ